MTTPTVLTGNSDSIDTVLARARERLQGVSDTIRLDAELLLSHVLGCRRTHLYTHPGQRLSPQQLTTFETLLQQRLALEPVAYIIGYREFWSLPLRVTRDTLVPRPETELLVELALAKAVGLSRPQLADLGTGTGAIAVALATERPTATVVATDCSSEALAIARENIGRFVPGRVELRQGDWCHPLGDDVFDLIICNPPYVEASDPALSETELQHEPRPALAAGTDGLADLRLIIRSASRHLQAGGWLLLEHGNNQAAAVRDLLQRAGFCEVKTHADTATLPRVSCGRWPP